MDSKDDFHAYDSNTNLSQIKGWLDDFAAERRWDRFHLPKNLSMSVAIEAAELMEHFQWVDPSAGSIAAAEKEAVAEEMADVFSYLIRLASILEIDLTNSLQRKMVKNSKKYPPAQG